MRECEKGCQKAWAPVNITTAIFTLQYLSHFCMNFYVTNVYLQVCKVIKFFSKYTAKYESLPSNIQQLFINKQEISCYSTRQKHKFAVKYARTSIKSKCLSVYGVKLWNKVPSSISLDSSFLSFKRNYKSYLLCEY